MHASSSNAQSVNTSIDDDVNNNEKEKENFFWPRLAFSKLNFRFPDSIFPSFRFSHVDDKRINRAFSGFRSKFWSSDVWPGDIFTLLSIRVPPAVKSCKEDTHVTLGQAERVGLAARSFAYYKLDHATAKSSNKDHPRRRKKSNYAFFPPHQHHLLVIPIFVPFPLEHRLTLIEKCHGKMTFFSLSL